MIIVIPGAYNAQTGVPGGNVQGQTVTVGAILKVTERDRRPYPTDPGVPSEIWIDNTAAIGYICKENGPTGTVWDRLDLLGDYIAFGDGNPGPNADILWGYRPGSLRYSRNSQTLWICDDNTQGAAIWSVLGGSAITLQTNGLPNGDQTLLNIVQGANMTITDLGSGNIRFDATGGGSGIDGANSRRWTGLNTASAPPPGLARLRATAGATTYTPSDVIDIRISRYDETNADMQSWFTALNNYRTTNPGKAYVQITDSLDNSVFGIYQIGNMAYTSTIYDYWTIGLTYVSGSVNLFSGGSTITFSWVLFGADGTGGGGTYTVNNGLSSQTTPFPDPNNFQLGGNIIQNTTLTSNSDFIIDRTSQGRALQVKNTFIGVTNSKDALYAETTDGVAGDFFVNGNASQYLNTDIQPIIKLRRFSQSGSANGIAGSIDFWLQNIPSAPFSLPGAPANRLVSKWENAVTNSRFSRFEIQGQTAGTTNTLLSLRANGEAILNQYGQTPALFPGTPVWALGVDAVGNVVEFTPSTGSTYTVNNGLSAQTVPSANPNNFQLGGSLIQNTTITNNGFDFIVSRTSAGNAIEGINTVGSGILGDSISNTGVIGISDTNTGVSGLSNTGIPIIGTVFPATNNDVKTVLRLINSNLSPADGTGSAIEFRAGTSASPQVFSGKLSFLWTDVNSSTRTSKFQVETINSGIPLNKLEVNGPGQLKLNRYGQTPANFSGTPVWGLGVDLNGNVIEYSPGTGGGDMLKSVYDIDNDGVVDSAERVEIIVRNSTGSTLTKGQIVYLSGATGNRPNALLADATTEATSSKTIGMVVADIANNSDGYVAVNGTLHDLNTNSFTAGDTLWLDTTPGGVVANTPPAEPNHTVFIGYVARAHPTLGRVVLKIQNGFELNELHGVLISSEANNDLLVYETSSTLWKNKSLSTAYPNIVTGSFGVSVDGITSVVQVGQVGYVVMPYAGQITGWSITANTNGNISFDITRASGAIPTVSIITSGFPTLSGTNFFTSTTVGGWSTSFAAGDVFGFTVRPTPSTIKNATLTIRVNKT